MRCARWLLGVLFVAVLLAIPAASPAQDPPDDPADVPAQVVPEDPSADDPQPEDPSLEPPQVLEDPGPADVAPVSPPSDIDATSLAAPPVTQLSRFSDDSRAPVWQQRDSWRERGWFYRHRTGWFLHRGPSWWRWVGRWTPCPQPGDWRPDVVRPVPTSDPSPGHHFDPVKDAIAPIVAPQTVPRPTPQQDRGQFIRRALRVCQARYARSVVVLRVLRRNGRITRTQYVSGVRRALVRRAVCRRVVLRLLSERR